MHVHYFILSDLWADPRIVNVVSSIVDVDKGSTMVVAEEQTDFFLV